MFAYLTGVLHLKEITGNPINWLILDVKGVGFQIAVSSKTLLKVGQKGEQITIQTALSIRENEWTIFGFESTNEKELFNLLQCVSGIGPKLALQITGTFEPDELVNAILSEDHKLISHAPGVGAKVAKRIIVELKTKIQNWNERRKVSTLTTKQEFTPYKNEVQSILEGLGYTYSEISLAMNKADKQQIAEDVESLVQFSLKILGAGSYLK